ncbi:MAG: hypothetical protein P8100_16295, partial [bacterium]
MTGELITGDVFSPALSTGGLNYELISNPYVSAIDFDALASENILLVEDGYWIWNPSAGNYVTRAAGTGASPYIQVGQGFFVQTKATGSFVFSNAQRLHSDTTSFLKEQPLNVLSAKVEGGETGFRDELYIRFAEGATANYDEEIEAVKWYSMHDDATMIYSVAEDETELAINVLPL